MSEHSLGVEVACDGPDEPSDCPQSAAGRRAFTSRTAPQVRADGRADGWVTRRRGGHLIDLCPACKSPATTEETDHA